MTEKDLGLTMRGIPDEELPEIDRLVPEEEVGKLFYSATELEEKRKAAKIKIAGMVISSYLMSKVISKKELIIDVPAVLKTVSDITFTPAVLIGCEECEVEKKARKFIGLSTIDIINNLSQGPSFCGNIGLPIINNLKRLKEEGFSEEQVIKDVTSYFELSEKDLEILRKTGSQSNLTKADEKPSIGFYQRADADAFFRETGAGDDKQAEANDGFPLGIDPVTLPEKAKEIKIKKITTKRRTERLTPEEHMKLVQKALQTRAEGFTQIKTAEIIGRDSVQVRRYEKRYGLDENGEVVKKD